VSRFHTSGPRFFPSQNLQNLNQFVSRFLQIGTRFFPNFNHQFWVNSQHFSKLTLKWWWCQFNHQSPSLFSFFLASNYIMYLHKLPPLPLQSSECLPSSRSSMHLTTLRFYVVLQIYTKLSSTTKRLPSYWRSSCIQLSSVF